MCSLSLLFLDRPRFKESFSLFYEYQYFTCMGICSPLACSAHGDQQGVLDPKGLELQWVVCELPGGCRELNPGALQEQPGLLTAKPSL